MAQIKPALLERLRSKLGVGQARVYALIDEKVRTSHLPRRLAAIALAMERGINISRYASEEDLAEIRQTALRSAPAAVTIPAETANNGGRSGGTAGRSRPRRTTSTRHTTATRRAAAPRRGTTVFVVHGRNRNAKDAIFAFLRAVGLRPLEWNQAITLTKEPSPYVGTILDVAFREAAAVVVLLTPDDDARLRSQFFARHDPRWEKKLTGQARPNVLFEAGMAFGKDPNSTVPVQLGEIRPFSDVAGRHILRLANSATSRQELATRLANAGCNVDTTGTDWLSAGDFSVTAARRGR